MRKVLLPLSVGIMLFFYSPLANAGTINTITLNDGSIIKGEVRNFVNGTYTLQTSAFGLVEIKDSEISSIVHSQSIQTAEAGPAQLKQQVGDLQAALFTDANLMEDVQGLINNEDVMKIIADKDFMGTVMSYDQEKIKNDPKTRELLNNPEIQKLMRKISQKLNQAK